MNIDITTQAGYDIATALRGPDSTNSLSAPLKALFTARLRYLGGVERHTGNAVRVSAGKAPPFASLNLWAWEGQRSDWLDGTMHFLDHVWAAFDSIASLGGWGFSLAQRKEAERLAGIATGLWKIAWAARCVDENPDGASETIRDVERQYQEYLRPAADKEVK